MELHTSNDPECNSKCLHDIETCSLQTCLVLLIMIVMFEKNKCSSMYKCHLQGCEAFTEVALAVIFHLKYRHCGNITIIVKYSNENIVSFIRCLLIFRYNLLDRRLPGHTFQVALKKLLVDQLLFSPVCLTVFFLSLGLFKGGDWQEFLSDLQHKGWRLYAAEWLVWTPAQLVNFYFLPSRFRVLFDNTISLLFDIYTSHICYDAKFEAKENKGKMVGLQREGKERSVFDLQENNMNREEKKDEYIKVQEQSTDGNNRMREVKTASVTFRESIMKSGNVS